VATDDGQQLIEWKTGEALAKLMSDSCDLKTVVELCQQTLQREAEAHAHLRQLDGARKVSAK
jgi:hypothetical protein